MLFQYLGTAAAEGIPGIFCQCAVCKEARAKGGRHIRTRSQAMIDDELLIDLNNDTYLHFLRHGIDGAAISHVLITHDHMDHFCAAELEMRIDGFCHLDEPAVMKIYGSEAVGMAMSKILYWDRDKHSMEFQRLAPFRPAAVGSFIVTALPAIHDPLAGSYIYLIEKDGKTILYGHDTGYPEEAVWDYLQSREIYLNLASLDCTEANRPVMTYSSHMSLNENVRVRDRLIAMGCADENTVFVCNHFSHNGVDVSYDTFRPLAEAQGFLTSYDGMAIEL